MTDRRRIKSRHLICVGATIGFLLSPPMSLIAQGSDFADWTKPPVVMSLIGVLLSVGAAWQMVSEDRRRIARLEAETIKRETFNEIVKRIDASLSTLVEEIHRR
jgi:Mg2+/citrate symporter